MTRRILRTAQRDSDARTPTRAGKSQARSTSFSSQILQMQKQYGNRAVAQMMLKRKFPTTFKEDSDSESDLEDDITAEFWVSNRDSEDEEEDDDLLEQDMELQDQEEEDLKKEEDLEAEEDLLELEAVVDEQETIQLPDFPVDPQYLNEVQRQINLQLEGIHKMTAKQWLVHAIVNRLRSSSKQTALSGIKGSSKYQKSALNASNRLASRLRSLLLRNDQLAALVINGVKERMQELGNLLLSHKLDVPQDITQVLQDTDTALQSGENAYQAFENAEGTHKLERLSQAGFIGGTGRQHGAGDEKEFRNQHGKGIEDLKVGNPMMNKNHILHNPDQCLGGPMQILWNQDEANKLAEAKLAYDEAYGDHARALLRLSNTQFVEEAQQRVFACELVLNKAKANYLAELQRHVGNGTVNTNLGGLWLQQVGSNDEKLSRFEHILNGVLDQGATEDEDLDLDKLDSLHLNVSMNAVPNPGLNWGNKGLDPAPPTAKKKLKKKHTEKDLLQKEKKELQKALEKLQSIHSVNRQTSILKFTSKNSTL